MSQIKDKKSRKNNYEDYIMNINKKKENLYNTYSQPQEVTDYNDQVIVYINLTNEPTIYKDFKKAFEIEKQLFTNHKKNSIYFHKPSFYVIDKDLIGCLTIIDFFTNSEQEQTILEKVTIKGVNMDALIVDLNKNGIDVSKLLHEIEKSQFNLDQIYDYLIKNNIDIAKTMKILNQHKATIPKILQNPYIREGIKHSSFAFFCSEDKNIEQIKKTTSKKIYKKVHCYAIYKLLSTPTVISINWTNIKI